MARSKTRRQRDFDTLWRRARDMLLFFGGMAGVAYETVWAESVEPTLVVLFGAMMGLPAFLRRDEEKKKNGNGQTSKDD